MRGERTKMQCFHDFFEVYYIWDKVSACKEMKIKTAKYKMKYKCFGQLKWKDWKELLTEK